MVGTAPEVPDDRERLVAMICERRRSELFMATGVRDISLDAEVIRREVARMSGEKVSRLLEEFGTPGIVW